MKPPFLLLLPFLFIPAVVPKFHDRKLFVSHFSGHTKSATELAAIRSTIHKKALANLHSIPVSAKTALLKRADTELAGHYVPLLAHDYMEFFRNGNRMHYQDKLHRNRERLSVLVVGHLLEREKNTKSTKYSDEILNGLWMMMEESTWCYPAHLSLQGTADHLPDPAHLAIDLNAGEMAKTIAWIKLLIGSELPAVVNKRLDAELRRRIFQGYLEHNFGWEGFSGHHTVNNWNIWVNGNILKAAIFSLEDVHLFNAVLNKTLHSADYFLDGYGEDGGCDEGPAYWRQAGGRLIEFLESIQELFPDAHQIFAKQKLLRLIGEYAYKMRISGNWFVNYADAIPVLTYPPSLLYKYGDLFADDAMKQYAAFMLKYVEKEPGSYYLASMAGGDLNEFWNYINTRKGIEGQVAKAPEVDLVWLPDIQVLNVRSGKVVKAGKQFFFSAKAGTNHESHNHNDVGNFLLFQGGHPVLIDIGVGTYTAQTFNGHRYELFYMQSQYHNCPTINAVQQHNGGAFEARNVSMVHKADSVRFSADIAGAYPKEAAVKHWIRSFDFHLAANELVVEDVYSLEHHLHPQQLHYILPSSVKLSKTEHGLHLTDSHIDVHMSVDWAVFELTEEVKSLGGDHHLTDVWGENVQRLTLTTKSSHKATSGHFVTKFTTGNRRRSQRMCVQ